MGSSRTISGPKMGAGIVAAQGPGNSKIAKAPAKPSAGKFENSVYANGSKPKGMSTYKAGDPPPKGYKA